ncbi:23S rRNA (adenine1618-N6)-methyltransferase [Gelidibacter algens]|uniref:23S rRNA (Adenine1618-N6)-methyltransferase n=1 Tax=Gelidibacter algens TaxID=49280 RepID=A0A1A7QX96_9FLAO|nr:23S rRNA (adenine(1618)-N(6))-methyltransferase RlmF [Gelidibacter algens]OBX23157.1 23S rRNA (adenine(1618)-N(6))-methyltransferase [Gelidibacter algens]RAJ27609.1 23S rRNA (adenine1618-N6)-methyltransferase [Gelidibacter algens]
MHKNSLHNKKYDFDALITNYDALKPFVFINDFQTQTIDFSNPEAVKALNTALLFTHYKVKFWEFPDENLCPPIPSRADYMHHLADLLRRSHLETDVNVLDVGTGASCIYPLLGHAIYNWNFVGTDIDEKSLQIAQKIIDKNNLGNAITVRFQNDYQHILKGILKPSDKFTAAVCNPPFFKSQTDALEATKTKLKGLGRQSDNVVRNFSGTPTELCYAGGEKAFLHNYLYESSHYKKQCFWFTSLVSNVSHVKSMDASLKKLGATDFQVLDMIQGNKVSRVVAWTFLTKAEQGDWTKN